MLNCKNVLRLALCQLALVGFAQGIAFADDLELSILDETGNYQMLETVEVASNDEIASNDKNNTGLTMSSTNLNMGMVRSGSSTSKKIVLTNSGTAPIKINKVEVGGYGYSMLNKCPEVLAVNDSCKIRVFFKSLERGNGSYSGHVTVFWGDPEKPTVISMYTQVVGGRTHGK